MANTRRHGYAVSSLMDMAYWLSEQDWRSYVQAGDQRRDKKTNFNQLPALCVIAQEIIDLAFTEKEIYSPILEKWHPLAVGVAVQLSILATAWNLIVNKSQFTPSVEEAISDTLEAFFLLSIPMHVALLPDLTNGLDRCLQDYILKAKSGSGKHLISSLLLHT
nr:hypothetical protein [Tanacetum cinerariifolium]